MVGNFARSLAGHDKNQLYIIMEETEHALSLVDGRSKTLQNPKMKNKKHIQIISKYYDESVMRKLQKHEAISNEEVKRAIKLYELEGNGCQKPM